LNTPNDSPIGLRLAELALALAVVAMGALVIWQTSEIRLTPINSRVGPRVIPYIIGGGLMVTGLWLMIDILRGRGAAAEGGEDSEDVDPTLPTDWMTVGTLAASLVAYLFLIERAGFIIASAVLFFGAAFGMGSKRYIRDLLIGFILSFATFVLFTEGLSLRLPEGLLPLDWLL